MEFAGGFFNILNARLTGTKEIRAFQVDLFRNPQLGSGFGIINLWRSAVKGQYCSGLAL